MRDNPETSFNGISKFAQELTWELRKRHEVEWFIGGTDRRTLTMGGSIPERFDLVYALSLPYGAKVKLPMVAKCNSPIKEEGKYYSGLKKLKGLYAQHLEVSTLKKAKAVISVSKISHDILKEKYSAESTVVPDGVDLEKFRPEKKESGKPIIMVCTRDEPRKNMPLVREAMKYVGDRAIWSLCLGGWRQTELEAQFREADIFLTTSLSEGFNQTLLQGMASGCACITSDIPAHRELMDGAENGLLFGNENGMKFKLDALIKGKQYRVILGQKARQKAEKYPWSRTAIETEAVFKSVFK